MKQGAKTNNVIKSSKWWSSNIPTFEGGMPMFKHVFATMNEVLDLILKDYQTANGGQKVKLDEELQALKAMSDECVEQWLCFEEKLGQIYDSKVPEIMPAMKKEFDQNAGKKTLEFNRGQGYYFLSMFDEAILEFQALIQQQPDFMLARVYLAMGYMRKGDFTEANRHFQFLLPLTESSKMKAITYQAMGCIQYQRDNLDKAYEYFRKAYHEDPTCIEPLLLLDEP
jgi:tetratricopeptide (TPR) repeat protein